MDIAEKILKDLINIDTSSPDGNESNASRYLYELFKEKASKVELIGDKPRENIIAYFGNLKSNDVLVFTGHLDVAQSNPREWKTNPYIAYKEDNKIYGRGACDMKGGIAMCIEAIFKALDLGYLKDKLVIFAGTADEETGASSSIGAKMVVKYLKEKGINPVGVILPEPNNDYEILKVNIGHRGVIWLECISYGKAMHPGSSVHVENNAITNMYNFINNINEIIPKNPTNKDGIPGSSCRVTYINAGTENGFKSIPDKCNCNLDVRVSPLVSNEEILNNIKEIAIKNNVTINCIRQANSSIINREEKFVKLLTDILIGRKQKYEICCASPVCDAHWFNEEGMITINTLGASGGNVHVNNEYAKIDSFDDRINIAIELIKQY